MDTPGSSKLTDEQADYYAGRFGDRYHAIAENPIRPNRKMRRAARHGAGRQPISTAEIQVFDRQMEAVRALEKARVNPVL